MSSCSIDDREIILAMQIRPTFSTKFFDPLTDALPQFFFGLHSVRRTVYLEFAFIFSKLKCRQIALKVILL